VRKLAIVVLVLLGLLVIVDRVAESYAEGAIADRIDAELDQRPDVEIGGVSFLLQALRRHYDEIRVSGERASRDGLGVSDFRADLEGVEVPLSDVVQGSVSRVPTEVIRGSALVRFADLAEVAGGGVEITAEGAERVRVTGSLTLLGRRVQASAVSDVAIRDERLTVRAVSYEVDGQEAPAVARAALADLLDLSVDLPTLPYRLAVEDLAVTKTGIRLAASARGVVLSR
jgi:hypothetical protein